MAAPFLGPLPALQYPQNALLNFAPINDAIDTSIANNRFQQQFGLQQQAQQNQVDQFGQNLDLSKQRLAQEGSQFQQNFGLEQQRTASQLQTAEQQRQEIWNQHVGAMAQMQQNEPDPQKRAAMWQSVVAHDPAFAKLPADLQAAIQDPENGPRLMIARAGLYKQPTYGVTGKNPITGVEQFGFINTNNQTTKPNTDAGSMGGLSTNGTDPNARGEEYLSQLPQAYAGRLRAMQQGLEEIPGPNSRKPIDTAIRQDLRQAYPDFNEQTWGLRYQTAKSYAPGGKDTATNTALSQAFMHAVRLDDHVTQLHNSDWVPAVTNTVSNLVAGQLPTTYQKVAPEFGTDVDTLKGELEKAFAGKPGAQAETEAWANKFSTNGSPTALHSAVREAMHNLKARLDIQADKYNQVFGTNKTGVDLMLPAARSAYQKFFPNEADAQGQTQDGAPQAAPPPGAPPGGKVAPDGKYYVPDPNRPGKVMRWDPQ